MDYEDISFINASKIYNSGSSVEKRALNNITLNIKQGDFVGIAGRNGSGKSTLARMINGLILPSSGVVRISGMSTGNRKDIKKIRSLVGMLFQNPDNQIISPIVEEDISFGPVNLGLSRQEVKERTDWALQVLGIENLRHCSPNMLSGGQKQKVAIASALAMKPSYLILDEPTSMLDNESKMELLSELKYLNSELHITIVLISHFMEDMCYANRIVILNKGEIFLDDVPWKLFSDEDKLKMAGISPPQMVCLLNELRDKGHKIDHDIITADQMEEYICQLLK